jgi:DNA-binding response OmpR family regulator
VLIFVAVEAMKHGAVGFLPKPFTPDELAKAVDAAMKRLATGPAPELPAPGPIDVDLPFDAREVAKLTSPAYVERLNRSDVQRAETKPIAPPPDFCALGNRTCKRFVSKGVCKQAECPIAVAERRRNPKPVDLATTLNDPIDVDMPFSASEVARYTSDAYVAAMGRSDLPIVGRWPEARVPVVAEHRVLVVDDEAVVVNSIRKTLTRKGFVVDEAFTGAEALSWVAGHDYDLVLLDMKLPDVIGLDLLPKIKRLKPELPVVIVTGYASIDTAVEAIRRGATDYMAKPFTTDELYTLAGRIVEQHQVHA